MNAVEQKVAEKFRAGIPAEVAARQLGYNAKFAQAVYRTISATYEWTPERCETLVALWTSRVHVAAIAVALECAPVLVSRQALALKLKSRGSSSDIAPRPAVKANQRPCMCCQRKFPSEGAHNRLCENCKRGTNLDYVMPHLRSNGARF